MQTVTNQKLEVEKVKECDLLNSGTQCIYTIYTQKIYSTSRFTSGAADGELDNRLALLLMEHSLCLTFPTSVEQRKKLRKCSHIVQLMLQN